MERIFKLQREFQTQLGNKIFTDFEDIESKENIETLKNQLLALIIEASEAIQELPWKSWKKNQSFSLSTFKVELIDILHFLVNLFIFTGMNVDDVFELFKYKNEINKKRQENGY